MVDNSNLAARAIEAGSKLSVKSALNPILWLCAIITIPCLFATFFIKPIPIWLIILIVAPVFAAIVGFFFLLFIDRDKLQSEEYQIKKRSLELIQQKEDKVPKLIKFDDVEELEDPN